MLRSLLARLTPRSEAPGPAPRGADGGALVVLSADAIADDRARFQRWLQAARRRKAQGSVAAVVLDGHETVRAVHGADAADAARLEAARRLLQLGPGARLALDGSDVPARYLLWLPGCDPDTARLRLQRCGTALREPFHTGHGQIGGLTLSAGLVDLSHGGPVALLAAADAALRAARARGAGHVLRARDETRDAAALRALPRRAPADAWTALPPVDALDPDALAAHGGAIAWIDIDHFGAYHEDRGRQSGDEALRLIVSTLQRLPRPPSALYRTGGAALVAVLPRVPVARLRAAGEELRQAVESLALPHATSPTAPVLTVTVGIAAAPASGSASPASLHEAAEAAARLGRNRGERNQVHATTARVRPPPCEGVP